MIPTTSAGMLMDSGEVVGSDGDSIGKVGQVYVDNETGSLSWVTVKTGWFGSSESFVPLDDATLEGSTITVPYDKAKVKDAPHHEVDTELSVEEEQDLYGYYGIGRSGGTADTSFGTEKTVTTEAPVTGTTDYGTTDTGTTDAGTTDTTVATNGTDGYLTRSEEQLRVGTTAVEAGRARLKKYVVTEQQTVTVPVSHDEVTLVREPIAAGEVTDAVIGDDSVEVTLMEDQVVVNKDAVAVEKIKLDTETITEQQAVTEAVRKEQVELTSDGVDTTRGFQSATTTDSDRSLGDRAKDAVK